MILAGPRLVLFFLHVEVSCFWQVFAGEQELNRKLDLLGLSGESEIVLDLHGHIKVVTDFYHLCIYCRQVYKLV